jgi:DNA-binding NtrC family response regulator
LAEKTLQFLAVTDDPAIGQVLRDLAPSAEWSLVVFRDAAPVFASSLSDLHMLFLDEAAAPQALTTAVRRVRKRFPAADITAIGGPKSEEVRAAAKRDGIDYYVERPVDPARLRSLLEHRRKLAGLRAAAGIVGRSPQMEEILEAILQVGPTEVPILIEGESGTGKDIVARAVHHASRRKDNAYVAINCASLAEGVLESELFGHERGAFTGAVAQRSGMFERADRGTIFLDEVGEMSANMQVRLLRVLESGDITRVGGVKSFRVDTRVVAATNRNLAAAVREGRFRQDLYYRLKGVSFFIPPLRERKDDIPLLCDHFLREAARKHGKEIRGIEKEALARLVGYPWPGNIRELRNVIDTAVVLAPEGKITGSLVGSQLGAERAGDGPHLPVPLHRTKDEAEREMIYASILAMHRDVRELLSIARQASVGRPFDAAREVFPEAPAEPQIKTLSSLERAAIREALRATDGNRRKAADLLGISERTLYRKIREYELS